MRLSRRLTNRWFPFACLATTTIGLSAPLPASAQEPWRVLLEEQLLRQEKCKVSYLTDLLVTGSGEEISVKGKAHCEDKRSYDAHLPTGGAKYEISACKPTYC